MTFKIALHGIKYKHEIYYLKDTFVCKHDTFVDCQYNPGDDSYIFTFCDISSESCNKIIATLDEHLIAFNYEFITSNEDLGFVIKTKYYVRKKEVDLKQQAYESYYRGSAKSYLNEYFGIRSSERYPTHKRRSKYDVKAIYKGVERKTGKFKTVVLWNESSREVALNKTTVCRIDGPSNDIQAFAYAYVKREYGSNSAFKRHVDKHTIHFGRSLFFDDGEYQAQISVLSNKDIYDQVALVMTFRDFGGAKNVIELVEEKTNE